MRTSRPLVLVVAAASLFVALVVVAPSFAGVNYTFQVNDGPNEGFLDPAPFTPVGGNPATTLGQARVRAFVYAIEIWAQCIESPVWIGIEATMDPLFCNASSAVLGHATAGTVHRDFPGAPLTGTYYPQALANSFAGVDLSFVDADIIAAFNSDLVGNPTCAGGANWYYGFDGNPPAGDFDFVTVVLHELLHASGFQTFLSLATGQRFMGFNDHYMINMEDHFASPNLYPLMSDGQRLAANTNDPNLHWLGAAVGAAGGGLIGGVSNGHVRLHGPFTPAPGSSLNHFTNFISPNTLMEPFYSGAKHDIGLAANLLDDIGWTVNNKTRPCAGAVIELNPFPPGAPPFLVPSNFGTRGIFFTAIKDFDLCAVAMETEHLMGSAVSASLYAANGTVRGALLATGSLDVTFWARQFHYIDMGTVTLQECEDYEIVFDLSAAASWRVWDKNLVPEFPFDVHGVVRVTEVHENGVIGTPEIPFVAFVGQSSSSSGLVSEVTAPHILWGTCTDYANARGAYVTAVRSIRTCKVGFEADFGPIGVTRELRVNIYEAIGTTRGPLVATGTAPITNGGLADHMVPVNAVLHEGRDYDIEVVYPRAVISCFNEGAAPIAFFVDDAILVRDGEAASFAADPTLPHLTIEYEAEMGGEPFDLVGPFHGPATMSSVRNTELGMYVLATNTVDVHSIGWRANLLVSDVIIASIYEATGGTRGPVVATETVYSGIDGMRWHEIPLAARLDAGGEYDIAVRFQNVIEFPTWDETLAPTTPYNAYGFLQILDAEELANAGSTTLPQIRVNACQVTGVGIGNGPVVPPSFSLAPPYPNPVSSIATVRFSVDSDGPVAIMVYDVAGRRVRTLLDVPTSTVGPGVVPFDSRGLASGVYFVRMQTPRHMTARRVVVLR